jgi:hypothetical protein
MIMGYMLVSQIIFMLEDDIHNHFYAMLFIIFLKLDLFVKTVTNVFTDIVDIITS